MTSGKLELDSDKLFKVKELAGNPKIAETTLHVPHPYEAGKIITYNELCTNQVE